MSIEQSSWQRSRLKRLFAGNPINTATFTLFLSAAGGGFLIKKRVRSDRDVIAMSTG